MEKTLQLILEKVTSMESDIKDVKQGQERIETRLDNLEKDVKELDRKITSIYDQTHDLTEFRTETKESLQRIEYKVDRTDNDVINLKTKLTVVK